MSIETVSQLLRRGAAAIETPGDLNQDELHHIAEDMCVKAKELEATFGFPYMEGHPNDKARTLQQGMDRVLGDLVNAGNGHFGSNGDHSNDPENPYYDSIQIVRRLLGHENQTIDKEST